MDRLVRERRGASRPCVCVCVACVYACRGVAMIHTVFSSYERENLRLRDILERRGEREREVALLPARVAGCGERKTWVCVCVENGEIFVIVYLVVVIVRVVGCRVII